MRNVRFLVFDNWYEENMDKWNQLGIKIEGVYDSPYANQRHIQFVSKYTLAHMALYESSDYYWVDFEALSLNDKPAFYRVNVTFVDITSIQKELQEFEKYARFISCFVFHLNNYFYCDKTIYLIWKEGCL